MAKKLIVKTESKHDLFLRLARPRTRRVLDALRILGNCSNKHRYEFEDDEIDKMLIAIREAVDNVENKFYAVKKEKTLFDF